MTNEKLNGGSPVLKTQTVLERSWEGLPGYILIFPVSIALSGSMSTEREQTIGMSKQERADLLLDFRIRLLGDVLTQPPKMLSIEKATEVLGQKQDKAYEEFIKANPLSKDADKDFFGREERERAVKAQNLKEQTALTEEELEGLYESFPGWDEITKDTKTLPEAVIKFFNQKISGRLIYQLLVEAIIQDYWDWANPRPTISASAFLQSKRLTSIKSSGS